LARCRKRKREKADWQQDGVDEDDSQPNANHKNEDLIGLPIPTRFMDLGLNPLNVQYRDCQGDQDVAQEDARLSEQPSGSKRDGNETEPRQDRV
jgi:hypothetical protein